MMIQTQTLTTNTNLFTAFAVYKYKRIGCFKLAFYLDDRYLSAEDSTFVELVQADVDSFVHSSQLNLVLLFPPVNNYLRLLIHKTIKDYTQLHSFSVGEGEERRTVVCWKHALKSPSIEDSEMSAPRPLSSRGRGRGRLREFHSQSPVARGDDGRGNSPGVRYNSPGTNQKLDSKETDTPKVESRERRERRTRRPDVQVYVPRGKRLQELQNNATDVATGTGNGRSVKAVGKSRRSEEKLLNTDSKNDSPLSKKEGSIRSEGSPYGDNSQQFKRSNMLDSAKVEKEQFNDVIDSCDSSRTGVPLRTELSGTSNNINENKQICDSFTDNIDSCVHGNSGKTLVTNQNQVANPSADIETNTMSDAARIGIDHIQGEDEEEQSLTNNHPDRCKKKMKISIPSFETHSVESGLSNELTDTCMNIGYDIEIDIRVDSQTDLDVAATDNNRSEQLCISPDPVIAAKGFEQEINDSDKIVTLSESSVDCMCSEVSDLTSSYKETIVSSTSENIKSRCQTNNSLESENDLTSNENTNRKNIIEEQHDISVERSHETEGPQDLKKRCENEHINELGESVLNRNDVSRERTSENESVSESVMEAKSYFNNNSVVDDETAETHHEREIPPMTDQNDSHATSCNEAIMSGYEAGKMETEHNCDSEQNRPKDIGTEENSDSQCSEYKVELSTHIEMEVVNEEKAHVSQEQHSSIEETVHEENPDSETFNDHNLLEGSDVDLKGSQSKSIKAQSLPKNDQNMPRNDQNLPESSVVDIGGNLPESTAGGNLSEERTNSTEEQSDEDSWDRMFDDNGDCLDPSAMEELTKTVGKVKIRKSKKINYLDYQPKDKSAELDYTSLGHIIEIYDFPAEFVTRDLIMAFQSFMSRGFDLKWVDDTHALGIFSSAIAAQDALDMIHPLLKVCPLPQATPQSKSKARRCTEFLLPYKPRPETSAVAARRLVAGALGLQSKIQSKIPKEKRDKERQQLKEAKAKQRQDRQKQEDIWEGRLPVGQCAMDEES